MKIHNSIKFAFVALFVGFLLVACEEPLPDPISVTSVTLNSTFMELTEGDSQTLIATISPSNADNQKVIWTSSNSSVASVKEGRVTAIKEGVATITAKSDDGNKTATCQITVKAKVYPVESISLDKTSAEMTEGDELTLTATVKPDNATNKNVVWSSTDIAVVTVSNGKIKAINAGCAVIRAASENGGFIAECNIKVLPGTPDGNNESVGTNKGGW